MCIKVALWFMSFIFVSGTTSDETLGGSHNNLGTKYFAPNLGFDASENSSLFPEQDFPNFSS